VTHLGFQTSETVSSASSRAIAGAPQNTPITSGANVKAVNPNSRMGKNRAANACASSWQPPDTGTNLAPSRFAMQAARPSAWNVFAIDRPVMNSTAAAATSAAAVARIAPRR
jgi:hypothetical protein